MDSRLECRFEHGDCVIHSPTTGPSTHRGPPALCSHAAAGLERRVERAAAIEMDHSATYTARVAALESRLAQAEAREAAMRAWIEDWLDTPFFEGRAEYEQWVVPMRQRAHALLSPDAGRALAAEVEKLREVARAAMKEHQPDGYRVDGHDDCPTCDALAKRGE